MILRTSWPIWSDPTPFLSFRPNISNRCVKPLVETLAKTLGDDWHDEIGAVWRKAFDEMAEAMIANGMDRAALS